jgi:hypothetical protein
MIGSHNYLKNKIIRRLRKLNLILQCKKSWKMRGRKIRIGEKVNVKVWIQIKDQILR